MKGGCARLWTATQPTSETCASHAGPPLFPKTRTRQNNRGILNPTQWSSANQFGPVWISHQVWPRVRSLLEILQQQSLRIWEQLASRFSRLLRIQRTTRAHGDVQSGILNVVGFAFSPPDCVDLIASTLSVGFVLFIFPHVLHLMNECFLD